MIGEPSVVFVDDHRLFGEPLTAMLGPSLRERGFAVLDAVPNAEEVPAARVPGVAVCDIRLKAGGPSGAAAVRLLTDRGWRVLLVSGEAPSGQVLAAVAAGAYGYLTKSVDPGDLLAAIITVAEGARHLSLELARLLYADLHRRPLRDGELRQADRDVLKAVTAGEDLARAASARGMSGEDVRQALARVFAAETRRWERHALTDREIEVARAFGCHHVQDAAEAAGMLNMAKDTVNGHLKSIRKKYLDTHPSIDGVLPKQQTTARLWAIELGLCPEDDDADG